MSDSQRGFAPAPSTGFTAGLAARSAGVAEALARAFGAAPTGFAPVEIGATLPSGSPATGPRHFSPADPTTRPTAGWDPFDPTPVAPTDPIAAAHAAGYAEGLAAAAAEHERDIALAAELARCFQGATRIDREALARRLRQTVLFLVARLVGEQGISPERLVERVAAATELLADQTESAILRMHPDDVALVDGQLPGAVFAVGDPHIGRGTFVLEAASTVIEDGPVLWLEQLAGAIDRVAVPAEC